jgi:hypothetical protein
MRVCVCIDGRGGKGPEHAWKGRNRDGVHMDPDMGSYAWALMPFSAYPSHGVEEGLIFWVGLRNVSRSEALYTKPDKEEACQRRNKAVALISVKAPEI